MDRQMENQKNTISQQQNLVLATISPYRLGIFKNLWIHFISEWSNVDENTPDRPAEPETLTKYLAKLKTEAVAQNHRTWIVIGFDTVGYFDGKILEKPKTREMAYVRLKSLSGKSFTYTTGIYALNLDTQQTITRTAQTEIYMRTYTDQEINFYLDNCNEAYKTHAHGFNPENYYSMSFIQKVVWDPNGTIGIPLWEIMSVLTEVWYVL